MNGNALSLGRNWHTADAVSLTTFGDCARVDFRWTDGAWAYHLFDSDAEARDYLRANGFAPSRVSQ